MATDLNTTMMTIESSDSAASEKTSKTVQKRNEMNQIMLDNILNEKDYDLKAAMTTILLNLFGKNNESRLDNIEDRLTDVENTVGLCESLSDMNSKELAMVKNETISAQVALYKTKILIRNLELHPAVKPGQLETQDLTQEIVKDLMVSMKVAPKFLPDSFRYRDTKGKPSTRNKKSCPIISATFPTTFAYSAFMQGLSNLKNSKHKGVKIDNDVPPILRGDWDRASKKAYEVRNEKDEKLRKNTRVMIKKNSVKLFVKGKHDKEWKEIDY